MSIPVFWQRLVASVKTMKNTSRAPISECVVVLAALLFTGAVAAADSQPVRIGSAAEKSRIPHLLGRAAFLPSQSVSAVEVSEDGRMIAVGTMAFRHSHNFWVLSDEGKILDKRYVLPWAPFQIAATGKGKQFALSLAYSRITPPFPTTVLLSAGRSDETVLIDNAGERGWLRYGGGDWRTGWLVSSLGDQVVRAGPSVYTINGSSGAWQLTDAEARKLPPEFPPTRPFRLAASSDGQVIAFANLVPMIDRLVKGSLPENFRIQGPTALVGLHTTKDWKELGRVTPAGDFSKLAELPDPAKEFPELGETFRMRADALLPFWVAASVALNADGSRCAITEYAGWLWIRARPAIGTWDPPYRIIPFLPRQRGWLRITTTSGEELARTQLPKVGLFHVALSGRGDRAWCYPACWFARGMAGCVWRPADDDARSVFGFDTAAKEWAPAWELPDAMGDLALHPDGDRLLLSCWDGNLYLLNRAGKLLKTIAAGGPARLQWSRDGRFAIVGSPNGEVLCLDGDGRSPWRLKLPDTELPPLKQPVARVFDEVPIYQVSRTGPEHAYIGDTWLIKSGSGGILIDAGGVSSIPMTVQRIESAGVDIKQVSHLLHTHSHGDHCGAGYLWRTLGLKVVAPESADFTLAWLMPMLTDYGVWPPRPVDVPLPLKRAGDEAEITFGKLKVRSIFVPGHSHDSVIYVLDLEGQRVVFTGDIGFDGQQDILHRCWGDVAKARMVTDVVRTKVLPLKPDFVFRGHGAKRDGTAWLEDLVKRSEDSIRKHPAPKE